MDESFSFGRFRASAARRELWANGQPVAIGARALDVLIALLRRPGELVTKDELVAAAWAGTAVEDNAIAAQVSAVRRALGDGVDGARFVQTVPGRGYRFVAPLGESPDARDPTDGGWAAVPALASLLVLGGVGVIAVTILVRAPAPPWSDRDPRMTFAITPVAAPRGDALVAAYADQFERALEARFNPALGDARVLPDRAAGTARYAVQLEFRRAGGDVVTRVTLRERAHDRVLGVREVGEPLGAAASPSAVWHASDLVKTAALREDAALAAAKSPDRRDARDLLIMAITAPADRSHNAQAVRWLEQAERLAPRQVMVTRALVGKLDERTVNRWSDPVSAPADAVRIGVLAQRLLRDDPGDPFALQMLADSYRLQGRWADAQVAAERLLKVKPDDAWGLIAACRALIGQGDFAGAEATADRLQAFQNDKVEWDTAEIVGLLRFHEGRYGEAAAQLRRAVQLTPQEDLARPAFAGLRLYLAAAEAQEGRLADARADLADFRAAVPTVHGPADFRRWDDAVRLPLVDWDGLTGGLAKIGWRDAPG